MSGQSLRLCSRERLIVLQGLGHPLLQFRYALLVGRMVAEQLTCLGGAGLCHAFPEGEPVEIGTLFDIHKFGEDIFRFDAK